MSDLQDRMEKESAMNRVAYATYQQLRGFVDVDPRYYPIMAAFVECEKQEAIHKALQNLLHEIMINDGPHNNNAVHQVTLAIQKVGNDWSKAIREFQYLTEMERQP